jgi:hypothetical protein
MPAKTRRDQPDFLDEIIAGRAREDPDFPRKVDEATRRRELLRALADQRKAQEVSQTLAAAAMGSSQSSLARLEGSAADAKLSTVQRLAGALGLAIQYHLLPADEASEQPTVVVHERTSRVPAR